MNKNPSSIKTVYRLIFGKKIGFYAKRAYAERASQRYSQRCIKEGTSPALSSLRIDAIEVPFARSEGVELIKVTHDWLESVTDYEINYPFPKFAGKSAA
jgi:hypothetical protein